MKSVNYNQKKVKPSKIVCVGRNYVEHIKELGNEVPTSMVIFLKPNSSISDILSTCKDKIHYEAEISFLVENNSLKGVAVGLDLTKREIQSKLKEKGLPWERAKAFDGAALFSDFVDFEDASSLHVRLYINDELVQDGGVELMMYKPKTILDEIQSFMSLEDGDIIMSGTPKGVGAVKSGDKFVGEILEGGKVLVKKEWIVS
ncbi:fumarylacetoacetate hydrolase family protein [Sulfurospirillum sp. 1307]